jgi:hypothetical protein
MFLLHVTFPSGTLQTRAFASPLLRALWMISLVSQDVTVRCEDRAVSA